MPHSHPSAAPEREALAGLALALVAAVGFSAKAILVKLAYRDGVDAVTLLALRMAFSVPAFLVAAYWTRQGAAPVGARDRIAIVVLGLLGYYLSSLLDFLGLQFISAGLERLILFLYPTMVVVLSAAMARRALRRAELVAMALSYGGIVLVFVHDAGNLGAGIATGALLVFGSAIAYAIYLLGAGRVIARVGAMRFTAWAMLVASLATLLQFGVIHGFGDLPRAPRVYGLALAMAAFSTVLPIFVLSAAIRRIGSSRTSLVGSIGPIATIYFAWKFLGEPITLLQVTGSALVLAGVVAVGLGRSWEPPDPTESPTSTGSAKPSRW